MSFFFVSSLPDAATDIRARSIAPHHRWRWLVLLLLLISVFGVLAIFWINRPATASQLLMLTANSGGLNTNATFSPNGQQIIAPHNGTVYIWNSVSGQSVLDFTPGNGWVYDVTYSPDGQRIATAGLKTRIWDASGHELLRIPPGSEHPNDISGLSERVVFSPDGTRLATLTLYTVRVYDATTGQLLLTILTKSKHQSDAISIAYSPDGTQLITGGQDGAAQIWDALTGQQLMTLQGSGSMVSGVVFSPDGQWIATANDHNIATVWNARTGEQHLAIRLSSLADTLLGQRRYSHFRDWASCIAFSPDGRRLAVGSEDASAGIWDIASGEQVLTLLGHTDPIMSIKFSPNGQQVVTSSADKTVRVWDVTSP